MKSYLKEPWFGPNSSSPCLCYQFSDSYAAVGLKVPLIKRSRVGWSRCWEKLSRWLDCISPDTLYLNNSNIRPSFLLRSSFVAPSLLLRLGPFVICTQFVSLMRICNAIQNTYHFDRGVDISTYNTNDLW